jgi:uncharacterized membrane protein
VNVSEIERWASLIGGGALAVMGLSRGTLGGLTLAGLGGALLYRGASGHCSIYQTLGINTSKGRGRNTVIPAQHGVRVEECVTVNRPASDLYQFWRHFENLPRFMPYLQEVRTTGPGRSHWVARGPMDVSVEWDAEIITNRTNEVISWRSLEFSEIDTAGSVHFMPRGIDRTEIRVNLKYDPPAGKAGAVIAKVFGRDAETKIRESLQRFKELMEGGAVATTASQAYTY